MGNLKGRCYCVVLLVVDIWVYIYFGIELDYCSDLYILKFY